MRLLLATIVFFAAVSGFAAPGSAQSVAVLRLDAQSVPFNTVGQLSRAVTAGVSLAGLTVEESAGTTSLSDVMLLIGCSTITPECLSELADTYGAPLLVYGTVRPAGDRNELQLTAFDARVPRMLFTVTLPVLPSRESEIVEVTASLMSGLGAAWLEAPGEDAVMVNEDGTTTPLPAWVHDLSNAERTVTVRNANQRNASVSISASGPSIQVIRVERFGRGRSGPTPPLAIAGWSAVASGAAVGVVAGVLGMRTASLQDDFDAEQRQRQARELADQGLQSARSTNIAIGVSAALLASGATALLLSRRSGRDVAQSPRWVAGSGGLGIRF